MSKQVEFFFDVGSPASYLAWTQLPALCAQTGAILVNKPMLLGGLFQATGNASPMMVAAKGSYMLDDLSRYARRYGVPLVFNPHFPINTLTLMRAVVGVQLKQPERLDAFLGTVWTALWVDAVNMGDLATVAATLAQGGFDPAEIMALSADADTKALLRANTEEAQARGAFGAPTMYVGAQMFFGQDRLEWVREMLS